MTENTIATPKERELPVWASAVDNFSAPERPFGAGGALSLISSGRLTNSEFKTKRLRPNRIATGLSLVRVEDEQRVRQQRGRGYGAITTARGLTSVVGP